MDEKTQEWLNPIRRKLSRTKWAARFLNIPRKPEKHPLPGVIMIQVDGLSYQQFTKGIKNNQLPFIRSLENTGSHASGPLYSGIPSTTPAFQAELFFGKKTAVPAFEFFDPKKQEHHVMFHPHSAEFVARTLNEYGEPLLAGGRSYSNIYAGGADEARYCVESMKLESLLKSMRPFRFLIMLMLYFTKGIRILSYALLEMSLGFTDFFRGILQNRDILKELKFIPTRVFICIILRELIRFRVKLDVENGVRIIHANLIGYDEQSHRRGPDSRFAMWTLKGIDDVIKDIYHSALNGKHRDYQMVVYSDHGQERVMSFNRHYGKPVEQMICIVLEDMAFKNASSPGDNTHGREPRAGSHQSVRKGVSDKKRVKDGHVQITTTGPVGHIYFPKPLSAKERELTAFRLVNEAHIPLVLFIAADKRVCGVNAQGIFDLRTQADAILGPDHPFLQNASEDLEQVVRHDYAGDLVFSGWRPANRPISFAVENGGHGGPGSLETRGFILLPKKIKVPEQNMRALGLRKWVKRMLSKEKSEPKRAAPAREKDFTLKVMSYNIHSCINIKRQNDPEGIMDIIARYSPDVVALQEVDVNRKKTGFIHQAELIAEHLGMTYKYFPLIRRGSERYGLGILSRYPFEKVKFDRLINADLQKSGEPRGAMWIKFMTSMGPVNFINTHLGLTSRERMLQIQSLLGKNWCMDLATRAPLILCGDFNAGVRSPVYRELSTCLSDVQQMVKQSGYPRSTFMSMYPIFQIDHIFISRHLEPIYVHVPKTLRARMASDHLPVLAKLRFASEREPAI